MTAITSNQKIFMKEKLKSDRFVMRITTQKGMINIDSSEICYGNIRGMYNTGNGNGLQLSQNLEHKRGEIIDICSQIAEKIYELQDILDIQR